MIGVDPDPLAVAVARSHGLDVRQGGIEVIDPRREQFDGITLSHVIEHVHDPIATLQACCRLLKSGGWIWVSTPNLDAQGHSRYGKAWLHWDPPRHLVLFAHSSLQCVLEDAGFCCTQDQPYYPLCKMSFAASEAATRHDSPTYSGGLSRSLRAAIREAERKARMDATIREFITMRAWKSPSLTSQPD